MTDMDPIDAMEETYGAEQSENVVRASLRLSECYFAWAFEPRSSPRVGILGDCIQTAFRAYLEAAHPEEFRLMKLAAKGFALPRIVIDKE